jgi:acetyl-CoA acetyltransferase
MRAPVAEAASRALATAGIGRADIDHFQSYDASTVLLPLALEGAGFCEIGEGFAFVANGEIALGGSLPCNTSGGMVSESYLHGWNLAVEAVEQLRHEAGRRQVNGAMYSMYCRATTTEAAVTVLARDDR